MNDLFISAEASTEPVNANEIKAYVGYLGDDVDVVATLQNIAKAARLRIEAWTGRNLAEKTMTWNINDLKTRFYLPYPPVNSVTSIKIYDEDGVLDSTWTSGTEYVLLGDFHKYLRLENYSTGEYVNIIYKSGYKSTGYPLPESLKRAILAQTKFDYEHRSGGGTTGDMMLSNEAMLLAAPFKEYAI